VTSKYEDKRVILLRLFPVFTATKLKKIKYLSFAYSGFNKNFQLKHVYRFILVNLYVSYLTLRNIVPLEKLTVAQLVKKFLAISGLCKFITTLKAARHWSLSSAR
jgi:hypothetical protein